MKIRETTLRDVAPMIYLVEQRQPFATAVRNKLAALGIVPITANWGGWNVA